MGMEIKIVLLKVDHLHNESKHARLVASMPFSNLLCYKHDEQNCDQCNFHYSLDIWNFGIKQHLLIAYNLKILLLAITSSIFN